MSRSPLTRGLERQLARRRELIADGHRSIGWKAGFGAPAWLEKFGLSGPLVGFLSDATLVDDGATVDITHWARPVAEPELAAHLGSDLPPGSGEDAVRSAIVAIGPAIELADIDPPPEDVEQILAGNIFHRALVLGPPDESRAGADLDGLEAKIRLQGQEHARTRQLEDLTGGVIEVVSHLSALLADHDEMMKAGEVVICGSVVPPLDLEPETIVEFELHPLPSITVRGAALDGVSTSE